MQVRFFNIDWDLEGEQFDYPDESSLPDLPVDVTLTVEDGFDAQNEGADLLSDRYGWCVNSFEFEAASEPTMTSST